MSEIKSFEGKLTSCEIIKEGEKMDTSSGEKVDWILYKYKIDEFTFTGFENGAELLNKLVNVSYKEKENPKNKSLPYRNVVKIIEAVTQNEPYAKGNSIPIGQPNDKPIGKPIGFKSAEDFDKHRQDQIFFGQILNLTMNYICNERRIDKGYTVDENFDKVFDHIYDKGKKKRTEVENK